ncbi:MAG: hypothetical protein NT027_05430 [Proteobacteria bacterium]|nr:hypothetical protein [Pseudomonadota bacterium]
MKRRDFLRSAVPMTATIAASVTLLSGFTAGSLYACENTSGDLAEGASKEGVKSFAFYQGLGPTERRSPNRPDGTGSSMPCIAQADIEAAVAKTYRFWHGHGGKQHSFTVSEENFISLQKGETIEIYTDIITGHRHALKIEPQLVCVAK